MRNTGIEQVRHPAAGQQQVREELQLPQLNKPPWHTCQQTQRWLSWTRTSRWTSAEKGSLTGQEDCQGYVGTYGRGGTTRRASSEAPKVRNQGTQTHTEKGPVTRSSTSPSWSPTERAAPRERAQATPKRRTLSPKVQASPKTATRSNILHDMASRPSR